MVHRSEKDAGGCRKARRYARKSRRGGGEARLLSRVHRMPGFVGASQVADHRPPNNRRPVTNKGGELALRQPEPRQPGIDVQNSGAGASERTAGVRPEAGGPIAASRAGEHIADPCPLRDLTGMVEHRDQPVRDKLGRCAGKRSVEYRDLRPGAERPAEDDALVERRDEKQPAPGGR